MVIQKESEIGILANESRFSIQGPQKKLETRHSFVTIGQNYFYPYSYIATFKIHYSINFI